MGGLLSGSTANLHWWQYGFFPPFCSVSVSVVVFCFLIPFLPLDEEGAFRLTAGSSGGGVRTSLSTDDARGEPGELVVFVNVGTVESAIGEESDMNA